MKIVTAAAALDVMGDDAVYTTEVFADFDSLVSVTGGVLWGGDLYLIGGGDPILSTPHYHTPLHRTMVRTQSLH